MFAKRTSNLRWTMLLAAILCMANQSQLWGAIDPTLITPGYGWVLHNNGHVFHGQLSPVGQDVTISQENLSITLKAKDIRWTASSLRGLYDYQVERTKRWGTGEHLHLARWCLENGMLDETAMHFEWLKAHIPNEPKVKQLEIQFREKLINDPVTRAAFQLPAERLSPSNSQEGVKHAMASAANDLSSELTTEYRESIVPILRSRCGQAGCHGLSSGQQFVVPPLKSQSPASLHRSLNGAVAAVNTSSARDSDLIRKAITAHSIQDMPPIDCGREGDSELLERLVSWVERVAYQKNGGNPRLANALQPSPSVNTSQGLGLSARAKPIAPEAASSGPLEAKQILSLEEAIRVLEKKEQSKRKDPFDPEQFNRQSSKGIR